MLDVFELDWHGGSVEHHFRQGIGSVGDLPWGTLEPQRYPSGLLAAARMSWTEGAFQEYCSAAAFATIATQLIAARAPIDLIGLAGKFVAEEMVHVELNARVAMELGGAARCLADFESVAPASDISLPPAQRAAELLVKTCCVGEALSVPLLAGCFETASHPLIRGVLERILRDESPHAQLGYQYLDWMAAAGSELDLDRLHDVVIAALGEYAAIFQRLKSSAVNGITREGFRVTDLHALGWMESAAYRERMCEAIWFRIVLPLRRRGVHLSDEELRMVVPG